MEKKKVLNWLMIFGVFVVYILLAFKNPFSDRNLIANLEPFPDTLLYTIPAWNLVSGKGFVMEAFDTSLVNEVPPIYGLFLAPFMAIAHDVRGFYFGNIVLGLVSIFLFYVICNFLFKNLLISGMLGFLLVTNFYFYTWPSLAMAENISVPAVMLVLYFILVNKGKISWIIGSLVSIGLVFGIKYSNLLLAMSLLFLMGWRAVDEGILKDRKWRVILGMGTVIILIMFLALIFRYRGILSGNPYFSANFFNTNFLFYLQTMMGSETKNLWFTKSFVDMVVVLLSIFGVIVGLLKKEFRIILIKLLVVMLPIMLFLGFFYSTEARFIMAIMPVWILVGGMGLSMFKKNTTVLLLIVLGVVGIFMVVNGRELRKQVAINLKFREDPWHYLCTQQFNEFLKDKPNSYFGSFLPTYYYYMFGLKNINYLPLASEQDFMNRGLSSYFPNPLEKIYAKLLLDKKDVYFSDYYVNNNVVPWRKELEEITRSKKVTKVYQSPSDSCNIYKLSAIK